MKEQYKLTKISDDKFEGKHPNGVFAGNTYVGTPMYRMPTVGDRFILRGISVRDSIQTSIVVEVLDGGTFKTMYSTYKLELIEDNKD